MKRRLYVLDAMRGIAALAVFSFHRPAFFGPLLVPQGFLAVDFFFMLSGFIMQYTYGERLASGWPSFAFLRARLIRLYPIYILGLILGTVPYLTLSAHLPFLFTPQLFWKMLLPGLAFIPAALTGAAFPLDEPAWSLLCEGIANVVHAFFLRRLSTRLFVIVICLTGAAFTWHTLRLDSANFGGNRSDLPAGIARALFSYTLGMMLHRWWSRRPRFTDIYPILSIAALLAVLFKFNWGRPIGSLVDVAIFLPVVLLMGAMSSGGSRLETFSEWLGSISYPVYLLHQPLCSIFSVLILRFGIRTHGAITFALDLLVILTVVLISWLAAALYDPPARAALNRFLPGRKHLPHAPKP